MVLKKQGDGLFGSNMKIAKELSIKVIEPTKNVSQKKSSNDKNENE